MADQALIGITHHPSLVTKGGKIELTGPVWQVFPKELSSKSSNEPGFHMDSIFLIVIALPTPWMSTAWPRAFGTSDLSTFRRGSLMSAWSGQNHRDLGRGNAPFRPAKDSLFQVILLDLHRS